MKLDQRKLVLSLCAALALLLPPVRSAALPFLFALFLAGFLQGPIRRLERGHVPRWLSALGILLLILAPLLLLIAYGLLSLFRSAQDLVELLIPLLHERGGMEDWLYRFLTALPPTLRDAFNALLSTLEEQKERLLTQLLSQLGTWSSKWLAALPGHLTQAGLFLLFFLFSAIGYPEVMELLRGILPDDWRRGLAHFQRATAERLGQWFRAQCKLVALIFSELALGLALLRFQSWAFLALAVALIDMVPLVGSGLILLPWAALRYLMDAKLQALGLVLIWVCVWATRTVLEPRLVGRYLQLPTALSFFAAILGASVWGLKGLILFPVLSAVIVGFLTTDRRDRQPLTRRRSSGRENSLF